MKHKDLTQFSRPKPARRKFGLRRTAVIIMAAMLLVLSSVTSVGAQGGTLTTQDMATGLTPENLANELVGAGGGVTISDVVYTGAPVSAGTFTGGADIIGFDSGIILSTGNIAHVVGPNSGTSADHDHSGAGDADLTALAGHETYNATVLEFNFVPNGDKIYFDFVFSSDEYNEFVNQSFNDVFAFYVNGTNCALVDGDPVTINSINNGNPEPGENATASHPELFRNNSIKQEDGTYTSPINTGMDGLTVVLPCEAPVTPNQPNTMKLAIADSSDAALDSNVFIKAGSLTTIPPTPTPVPQAKVGLGDSGDVHIRTPDGLVYDFQEVGDFILTQSTDGSVVLQARQTWWESNPRASINTAAALNVAGVKLEFYIKPNQVFTIDDVETPLPTGLVQLSNGGTINLSGTGSATDFTIMWPDGNTGARVVMNGTSYMDIGIARLNGSLTYEGVLGNLDGNAMNDLTLRDGSQMTPPATPDQLKTFGASWLVPAGESLFDDTAENSVVEETVEEPLTLFDIDPEARADAKETCEEADISDSLALDNCTYDVAVTGDPIFVESAKTFEESHEDNPASEGVEIVMAVPSQNMVIGEQYAVADAVPGTFRYFQLTQLPTESESRARLSLCPDGASEGLVVPADLMSETVALEKGLEATNEPCVATEAVEVVEETTAETTDPVEPTEEARVEPTEEVEPTAETGTTNPVSGLCNAPLVMPLFVGIGLLASKRRKKRL